METIPMQTWPGRAGIVHFTAQRYIKYNTHYRYRLLIQSRALQLLLWLNSYRFAQHVARA